MRLALFSGFQLKRLSDILNKSMKDFLHHLFFPRESNNHRAKILHNSNLFLAIVFLFLTSFLTQNIKEVFPSVLGIANNINIDSLVTLTNKEREENGVPSLTINSQLSQAAAQKAEDMLKNDYWAHNSPDGTTPWVFIKNSGYNYIYAGENLARGFSTSEDVVAAWMGSPSHKSNMLSSNYKDVGFAVVTGKLKGEDTVLVVEEFGSQSIPIAVSKPIETAISSDKTLALAKISNPVSKPVINSVSLSSSVNIIVISIFLFAFVLDMIVVERKKIVRFVGHNVDHIFYLFFLLILIGVFTKGVII